MRDLDLPDFSGDMPVASGDVAVILAPPDAGWIDFTLTLGDAHFQTSFSYVYCPFEAIRDFLIKVALGEPAELLIDVEGFYHFLRTGPALEAGLVRIGIWSSASFRTGVIISGFPTRDLDAVVCRTNFVTAFYTAIMTIWGKPDERAFKFSWTLYVWDDGPWDPLDGPEPLLLVMRSEVLDRILAASREQTPRL